MTDHAAIDDRRVNRLLKWLDKQRASHLDMVTDAGDASMWCKEEAELIRDHMQTVGAMRREIDEQRERAEEAKSQVPRAHEQVSAEAERLRDALEDAADYIAAMIDAKRAPTIKYRGVYFDAESTLETARAALSEGDPA